MVKSSDAFDLAWAKAFARKERLVKYITKQRGKMASMLATIHRLVCEEEVIPGNEESNSHFDTEFLPKGLCQQSTLLFDNEIAELPKVKLSTGTLS